MPTEALALLERIRVLHAGASAQPDVFTSTLVASEPASAVRVEELEVRSGFHLPLVLRALYAKHASLRFDWSLSASACQAAGFDAVHADRGHFELLSPEHAREALDHLEELYDDRPAAIAGLVPFARLEPGGDWLALDHAADASDPPVVVVWHDEISTREPLSPDLASYLRRHAELAFIDGYIEGPNEEPDRFLAHVLALLQSGAGAWPPEWWEPPPPEPKPAPNLATPPMDLAQLTLEKQLEALDDMLYDGNEDEVIALVEAGLLADEPGAEVELLHAAASTGAPRTVAFLRARGVDIHAVTEDGPLLHSAVDGQVVDLVRDLLGTGVDPMARDRLGRTALHYARSVEVAKMLIGAGADPGAKDLHQYHSTPAKSAEVRKHPDVAAYLRGLAGET